MCCYNPSSATLKLIDKLEHMFSTWHSTGSVYVCDDINSQAYYCSIMPHTDLIFSLTHSLTHNNNTEVTCYCWHPHYCLQFLHGLHCSSAGDHVSCWYTGHRSTQVSTISRSHHDHQHCYKSAFVHNIYTYTFDVEHRKLHYYVILDNYRL